MNTELVEKAKNIKAIFFDIDDTLRLKDKEFMPESVPKIFEQLKSAGYLTGIASGRAYYGIVPEVRALGADFYVTINGQYVQTQLEKEVFANPIPQETVETIVQWAKENGIELAFVGSHDIAITSWNEYAEASLPVVYGKVKEDADFYKNHRVFQLLTLSFDANALQLPESVQENVRLVKWHTHSNDIVPTSGSKANGISKVLEMIGLTKENLLVFGDELNDLEMFEYAEIAVAMGVSHPELQKLASFVTKNVEDHGIEDALIQLGLIHS
ncbi:MAG: Cof-type HAD-IIB family hydrolase [Streptococcaceae bacterium]|jgi:Cof subfamily protein (haloacid dehalogenase superfamily)|nr:Cof-type HAD-IIB family hydrolase [Streptococcaceae bacterium]